MDYGKQSDGLQTFLEHWGCLLTALFAFAFGSLLTFFFNLAGRPWIYFFVASMGLLLVGAAMIIYAKMPLYRSGRFLTFGVKSIPVSLAGYYRWGWRLFSFGVALSLCLLLSRQ